MRIKTHLINLCLGCSRVTNESEHTRHYDWLRWCWVLPEPSGLVLKQYGLHCSIRGRSFPCWWSCLVSEPPPTHCPLIKTLGTVLAPVICAKVSWRRPPSLCWSSSTTLYVAPISLNTFFAIVQYGHVVLENITTQLLDTTSWTNWAHAELDNPGAVDVKFPILDKRQGFRFKLRETTQNNTTIHNNRLRVTQKMTLL